MKLEWRVPELEVQAGSDSRVWNPYPTINETAKQSLVLCKGGR